MGFGVVLRWRSGFRASVVPCRLRCDSIENGSATVDHFAAGKTFETFFDLPRLIVVVGAYRGVGRNREGKPIRRIGSADATACAHVYTATTHPFRLVVVLQPG